MAPFSYLINKHGDDMAILWIDSHPDMGTGETTYPGFHAMVVSALTGETPAETVGRGTGVDDIGLARKRAAVTTALALHAHQFSTPTAALAAVGGLEIAAIAGAALTAAEHRIVVVADGFIASGETGIVGPALGGAP